MRWGGVEIALLFAFFCLERGGASLLDGWREEKRWMDLDLQSGGGDGSGRVGVKMGQDGRLASDGDGDLSSRLVFNAPRERGERKIYQTRTYRTVRGMMKRRNGWPVGRGYLTGD